MGKVIAYKTPLCLADYPPFHNYLLWTAVVGQGSKLGFFS